MRICYFDGVSIHYSNTCFCLSLSPLSSKWVALLMRVRGKKKDPFWHHLWAEEEEDDEDGVGGVGWLLSGFLSTSLETSLDKPPIFSTFLKHTHTHKHFEKKREKVCRKTCLHFPRCSTCASILSYLLSPTAVTTSFPPISLSDILSLLSSMSPNLLPPKFCDTTGEKKFFLVRLTSVKILSGGEVWNLSLSQSFRREREEEKKKYLFLSPAVVSSLSLFWNPPSPLDWYDLIKQRREEEDKKGLKLRIEPLAQQKKLLGVVKVAPKRGMGEDRMK